MLRGDGVADAWRGGECRRHGEGAGVDGAWGTGGGHQLMVGVELGKRGWRRLRRGQGTDAISDF